MPAWPTVPPPEGLAAALGLEVDGPLDGRADVVATRRGERSVVLKTWAAPEDPAALEASWRSLRLADGLRDRGVPVPELLDVGVHGGVAWSLHGRLPGAPVRRLTARHVGQVTGWLDACVGAAEGVEGWGGWADELTQVCRTGLPGHARSHEPARSMDVKAKRLLQEVVGVGRAPLPAPVAEVDVMPFDLNPSNLLVDGSGDLVGVVDWDGCRPGDVGFAIVTLDRSSALDPEVEVEPEAAEALGALLWRGGRVDGRVAARCCAYLCVRYLAWAAETRPDELPTWVRRCEQHLAAWWR